MEFFKRSKPIGFDYTPTYYKGEKHGVQETSLNKGFLTHMKKRQTNTAQRKLMLYRFILLLIISISFIFFLSHFMK